MLYSLPHQFYYTFMGIARYAYFYHSGFRDNVSIILIDKTDGPNPTKRETY